MFKVSGEYSMLMKSGEMAEIKSSLIEIILSMRRAGLFHHFI